MPVISSSVPPSGRSTRRSSVESGKDDPFAVARFDQRADGEGHSLPPGAEDAGIAGDDRSPVVLVREANDGIAQILEPLGQLEVSAVPVGETGAWARRCR